MVSEKTYAYTTGEITDETATVSTNGYTYGDEDWGDLLTAHNGSTISYDAIGNPLSDANRSFTWEHGRQMATQTRGDTTWTYTYDTNGMRTSRSNGTKTYKYVYSGDKLVQMTVTDTSANTEQLIEFTYDAVGQPLTMTLDGTVYYYLLNIQGDVMGLVDGDGNLLVSYLYEAYGECFYITDTSDMVNTLISANPLLYRSYLIDTGTGLYYLQSRYYDPALGRFLNADAYASTGQGLLSNNTFAYCGNNPVMFKDSSGLAFFPCTVIINDGNRGESHDDSLIDFGEVISNDYELISIDSLFIHLEQGVTTSYAIREDYSKPVFFYFEHASRDWRFWESKVGVQVSNEDGGCYMSVGLFEQSYGVSVNGCTLERTSGLSKVGFTITSEHNFLERTDGTYWHGYIRPIPTAVAVALVYYTSGAIIPVFGALAGATA